MSMAAWVSQLRKGLVEFCILLVIGSEECYGYSLVQRLRGAPNLSFTEGTVYPALARLIDEGLIRATGRASPMGPPRRYLSLTALGKRRLTEMSAHWLGVCSSVEALMRVLKRGDSDV
jgi:PadR family transcriptional regulator PadR